MVPFGLEFDCLKISDDKVRCRFVILIDPNGFTAGGIKYTQICNAMPVLKRATRGLKMHYA